jgi:GWxTD domain-containing protein
MAGVSIKTDRFMKKFMISFVLTACLLVHNTAPANVLAYMTSASFNVPGKGPYYETYLSVIGSSLKFVKNSSGKFQGTVDISIQFLQNGVLKNAQKYSLNSPELTDTTKGFPNFIDQQRYPLANGMYDVEISITDKNSPESKPLVTKMPINIRFPEEVISASDIQMLESYTKAAQPGPLTKSGYDLMPYVSTYFPENATKLKFYAELYNAKKVLGEGQKMILNYFLENYESKKKLSDYSAFSKQNVSDVNILLAELNIASLPTGNYNLVIEVRDKDNLLQAEQKCFIQRSNKPVQLSTEDLKSIDINNTFVGNYKSLDTLMAYMRCLRPISSSSEMEFEENQLKEKNLQLMQQFFYVFWKTRNSLNPEASWLDYYKEVVKVNKEFGTYGLKGYDTDRGRVYLQYGAPDQRSVSEHEPSAYPYEIWEYYTLTDKKQVMTNPNNRQSNKKFVFYNPDLVSNKYKLIHSTAKGEIYNTSWDLLLHKRDTQTNDMDSEKAPDHFGGNANDSYSNPR